MEKHMEADHYHSEFAKNYSQATSIYLQTDGQNITLTAALPVSQ